MSAARIAASRLFTVPCANQCLLSRPTYVANAVTITNSGNFGRKSIADVKQK